MSVEDTSCSKYAFRQVSMLLMTVFCSLLPETLKNKDCLGVIARLLTTPGVPKFSWVNELHCAMSFLVPTPTYYLPYTKALSSPNKPIRQFLSLNASLGL